MTWIVRVALERPLTFIVLALLILIFGPMAAVKTPTDIFPSINVPVIGVAFQFANMSPQEMSNRIVTPYERILTTTVDNIEHVESQSMLGAGIVKIFFQPDVDIRLAMAQVTAISQTAIRQDPPGTQPPLILNYDASTVPVLQIAYSSNVLSEQQLFDLAQNTVRPRLATVRGAASPGAYGGKTREVLLELDPQALQAHNLSAQDVQNAVGNQTLIVPAGNVKIGSYQYTVKLNNAAETIEGLNNIPIKTMNGVTVFLRDVGHAVDGNAPQQNVVHAFGGRAVLSTMLKTGNASTLDVVDGIKTAFAQAEGSAAGYLTHRPSQRSVDLREGCGYRRGARGRDCRGADQPDDPAVPGQLAFHRHYRHLDSPGGVVGHRGAVGDRPNPQHHDFGRSGAGGGHSGRRRHRHHREHQLAS